MAHTILAGTQRPTVTANALQVLAAGGAATLLKLGPQLTRLRVHAAVVIFQQPLCDLGSAQGTASLLHAAHAATETGAHRQQFFFRQSQLGSEGQQHSLAAVVVAFVHHGTLAPWHSVHRLVLFHLGPGRRQVQIVLLAPLRLDRDLCVIATYRANHMGKYGYSGHYDASGKGYYTAAARQYFGRYVPISENINNKKAAHGPTLIRQLTPDNQVREAHASLLTSPPHVKLMNDPTDTSAGFGIYYTPSRELFVQLFAEL